MNPDEVVMSEVQGQGALEVAELLGEGISQTGESTHLHPNGEVLTLNIRSGNELDFRAAHDRRRDRRLDAWWAIAGLSGSLRFVQLDQLGEVHACAMPRLFYGITVGREAVRRELDATGQAVVQIEDKGPGRWGIALSDREGGDQLAVGVHRYEDILIANLRSVAGGNALLLLPNIRPDFINLNKLGPNPLHPGIQEPLAPVPGDVQEPQDCNDMDAGHPLNAADAVSLYQSREDGELLLPVEDVHGLLLNQRGPYTGGGTLRAQRPSLSVDCPSAIDDTVTEVFFHQ